MFVSQDRLDGQVLVPYQCVVRRDAWESIRERFNVAYPLQKTAYRHANGGSGAPGMYLGWGEVFVARVEGWSVGLVFDCLEVVFCEHGVISRQESMEARGPQRSTECI